MITAYFVQIVRTNPDFRDDVPDEKDITEIEKKLGWTLVPEDPEMGCYIANMQVNDPHLPGILGEHSWVEIPIPDSPWTVLAEMP
jgi:hypothetical protein